MSISPGLFLDSNVSGVPQLGQNVRSACADDLKLAGLPIVKRSELAGTVNHATNGAPLVRRQVVQ
jgi:hypothetical protein